MAVLNYNTHSCAFGFAILCVKREMKMKQVNQPPFGCGYVIKKRKEKKPFGFV